MSFLFSVCVCDYFSGGFQCSLAMVLAMACIPTDVLDPSRLALKDKQSSLNALII